MTILEDWRILTMKPISTACRIRGRTQDGVYITTNDVIGLRDGHILDKDNLLYKLGKPAKLEGKNHVEDK